MSAYATSSPVCSPTRLFRIRSEVPARNWLKWIDWSSVAEYRPTGTLTRPKLRDPVQTALAILIAPLGKTSSESSLNRLEQGSRAARSPELLSGRPQGEEFESRDRKSTRLNSSHL